MTTLMTTSRTALGGALALALAPAFWPSDAAAHTCDAPFTTDLVTAKGIDVGEVKVCNDAEFLTVTYDTTYPWCVLRTNLHVASDLAGIPKFRLLGTPNWLRFDFIEDVDCEGQVTFDIPLDGSMAGSCLATAWSSPPAPWSKGKAPTAPTRAACSATSAWRGARAPVSARGSPRCTSPTRFRRLPRPLRASATVDRTNGTTGGQVLAQLCPLGVPGQGVAFGDGQQKRSSASAIGVTASIRSKRLVDGVDMCGRQD